MSYKVDNAVIMAAGASSRFAPLSYERPKALISIKGEVLIERQIRQLKEAGIDEIIIVVGYKKELFYYLKEKWGVIIVVNNEYAIRNNNSSIYMVKGYLRNTYICSADNYFVENPFEREVDDAYYAALYSEGTTEEWCMGVDESGHINSVQIGGVNAWYMLGHVFWNYKFSTKFTEILLAEYDSPETVNLLWESIYIKHLDELKLKIRKYKTDEIFEFDSLDELRIFDETYINHSGSVILARVAEQLGGNEGEIVEITAIKTSNGIEAKGFEFTFRNVRFEYIYDKGILEKKDE